jgi:hypothetical protein
MAKGTTMIRLVYEFEEGAANRSIEVKLDYEDLEYTLENVRWFLSLVYMWDVGDISLSQDEDKSDKTVPERDTLTPTCKYCDGYLDADDRCHTCRKRN